MRMGIVTLAAGCALLIVTVLFSSGYNPRLGLLGSLPSMEIVMIGGRFVEDPGGSGWYRPGHYEGRIAIPTRWPAAVASLLMIAGVATIAVHRTSRQ